MRGMSLPQPQVTSKFAKCAQNLQGYNGLNTVASNCTITHLNFKYHFREIWTLYARGRYLSCTYSYGASVPTAELPICPPIFYRANIKKNWASNCNVCMISET